MARIVDTLNKIQARHEQDRRAEKAVAEAARPTLISTGTRSTSTPAKSDETPREAPFGGAFDLTEERAAFNDAMVTGTGFVADGKRVAPERVRVSSPELASLAAKYLDVTSVQIERMTGVERDQVALDVRRLAASVLSQAEGGDK